ncbi:MAG: AI-2E family transporter [Gammaproteobacteria bacterium]|nr:AI-2E family transporter [Gammaproteobacteria bacterium]MYF03326.1 AI-2E family transporter [Gammaproteobacteria bacterium]MYI76168.1 AI-2E family transporter [Gammaproteobacteria bacterium]
MQFVEVVKQWINRYFSNTEIIYLLVAALVFLLLLLTIGRYLAPVLIGFVFAYVLQGIVDRLEKWKFPHLLAVIVAMLLFVGGLFALVLVILPVVWTQLQEVLNQLPILADKIEEALYDFSEDYPALLSTTLVDEVLAEFRTTLRDSGTASLTWFVKQLPNLIATVVFLLLVPIAMFFFLKDRETLKQYFERFLPKKRPIIDRIGQDVATQLGSYIRGKFLEILIVGTATYVAFILLGLKYAALLALLVGLSVIFPIIGAAVVTIPVVVVALMQFGWSTEFLWIILAYATIQALDGNLLVPLLFAEVVKLHPLAIVASVLVFGGLGGVWGLFFAIPLAIFIKAVTEAWPREEPIIAAP